MDDGWVAGIRFRDWVRSSNIRDEREVEQLPFRTERSHLRWFRHLIRMHLLSTSHWRTSRLIQLGGGPSKDPEHTGIIIYLICPQDPQGKLENVAGERDFWSTLLLP